MAQKKQTKKSAASRAAGKGSKASANQKQPIHREVGAFVCLGFAILSVLSCFRLNAAITNFLRLILKGFIGGGFYVMPFAFLMAFVILLLHDGRPVAFRVTCTFLTCVTVGALAHLTGGEHAEWSFDMVGQLWNSGVDGQSGGVLAGLLSQFLELLITKPGTLILLVVALILELLKSLNMTISGIIKAIRERPRVEYAPPKKEHRDPAETIVNHVAQKHVERAEARQESRQMRIADFDLDIDEPPLKEKERQQKHRMSPDDYILEKRKEKQVAAKPAAAAEKPEAPAAAPDVAAEPEEVDASRRERMEAMVEEFRGDTKQYVPVDDEPVHQMPPLVLERKKAEEVPLVVPASVHTQPVSPEPAADLSPVSAPIEPAAEDKPMKKQEVREEAAKIEEQIQNAEPVVAYRYPSMDLLRLGSGSSVDGTEEMRQNSERLNDTLNSFGIEAHIINVTRGPSVTRYELELNRGVKLSKVTNLADDIALSLGASGVRIAAIPDKISVVGIEVPNRAVSTVVARDVLDSNEFQKGKSRISFAVGKDIGGNCIVGDIAKLPHMLIAGTTGSGKSVCMNSLIISLLYKAKPEEVKLIMVDPKMVELGIYNGIPHLLIPVVTDPKKAAGALQWGVTEMMRRYQSMADAGVRDLDSFNKLAEGNEELHSMPKIVVVIDELADLMLVAAKEVEESICRIAQMGRAAGIHLVIATQRPSADVITGLMKANIPSRIAFAVASAMESRIILDTSGAEKLVGKGDMLYAPLGQGKPKRVQGCFISDEEVQDVVEFIKSHNSSDYSDEINAEIERRSEQNAKPTASAAPVEADPDEGDEMMPDAVEVLLETGQASVSMLQRRLKLGYARAARIMDELEEKGIVGPFEGSKPRQILITREQWERTKDGSFEEFNQEPVEDEIP